MPKRTKNDGSANDKDNEQKTATVKHREPSEQTFKCDCGKSYGSLAAVHTHINNKHSDQKKKYKNLIQNPKKNGQGPSTSIRMKDIVFPKKEAELMCLADNTLMELFQYVKKVGEETKVRFDILEGDGDFCSDQEIQSDWESEKGQKTQSKREIKIKQLVNTIQEESGITQIETIVKGAQEMKSFKIQKFTLNLIKEFEKFFKVEYAAKVNVQLKIIIAQKRVLQQSLKQRLIQCQNSMWKDIPNAVSFLQEYQRQWQLIYNQDHIVGE